MSTSRGVASRRLVAGLIASLLLAVPGPGIAASSPGTVILVTDARTLTYARQPSAGIGGVLFGTQPVVHVEDGTGAARADEPVTLGIIPGTGAPGATLTCNATTLLTDELGNATFTDCQIDRAGNGYRLSAQALATSLQAFASAPFDVALGPPSGLAFVGQPIEAFVGHPFDLIVGITDRGGNLVSSGVSATITIGAGSDAPEDVILSCPGGLVHPTVAIGPGAGTATFSGCTLDGPNAGGGTIELEATASDVTGAASLAMGESAGFDLEAATEAPLRALTVAASPRQVAWGQTVTLAVNFSGGGSRRIELHQSVDGTAWMGIGNITTDASGRGTFVYRPRTTAVVRAVFAGPPAAVAGSSDRVTVLVRLLAIQRPVHGSPTTLRRGTSVTFSTTVRPAGGGTGGPRVSFLVYRLVSGAWQLTATRSVRTDASGVARLTWRFGTAGEFYVRSKAIATRQEDVAGLGANADSVPTSIARYRVR